MPREILPSLLLSLLLSLVVPAPSARATATAAIWFDQSLLCQEPATGAACTLWLNPDGRYAVFYDRNRPTPHGRRYEGRTGRYAARPRDGGIELCLRPDPAPSGPGTGIPLFHDESCVILPVRPIGEPATLTYQGHTYTMQLAQGR